MPKISVVIPVYNVREYLERCLSSLESQTLEDFEAIIVDDGSPDTSHEIYRAYAARDSRFRFVRKENEGVSRARNTGISMATGEYVICVDSDDWLPEDALETLYGRATETGADLTVADVTIIRGSNSAERIHVFDEDFFTEDRGFIDDYKKAILAYVYNPRPFGGRCLAATGLGGPWNKLVKRTFIEEHTLEFDPYLFGIFDDCLFSLNVLSHASSVAYVAKSVYFYRVVESSLLHAYNPKMLEVNAHIFARVEQYIATCEDSPSYRRPYAFYVVRRFDETLDHYFFADNDAKSFSAKLAELRETVGREPYKSAFINVDKNKLNRSRRAICGQARRGNVRLLWLVWKLRQIRAKRGKRTE